MTQYSLEATNDNRINWIDTARCLGLCLILFCHIPPRYGSFHDLIYCFHVPMFFILSGIFLKDDISLNSIWHSFKRLIIPYFIYNIVLQLILCAYTIAHGGNRLPGLIESTMGALIGSSKIESPWHLLAGPSWFLPALFIARFVAQISIRILNCATNKILTTVFIGLALFGLYYWPHTHLDWCFWSFDAAILGAYFIIFGHLMRSFFLKIGMLPIYTKISLFVIAGIALWFLNINGTANMFRGEYGNRIDLFFINGIIGTIAICALSAIVSLPKIMTALFTKGAIFFICAHVFIMDYVSLIYVRLSGRTWDFDTADKLIVASCTILCFIAIAAILRALNPKLLR